MPLICPIDVGAVSTTDDSRAFLTTRRAKVTPQQAGLPVYGENRRVAGLRREEVAVLAGISVEYYTRLERGNVGSVSEGVVELSGPAGSGQKGLAHLVASTVPGVVEVRVD